MAAAPKKKKTSQPAKKNTRTPPPPAPTYGREIAGGVCLLLALCAVVSYFQEEALFITFFGGLLKGLLGYGYWLSAPALLLTGLLLLTHRDRPATLRSVCTMLVPVLTGCGLHLLLCAHRSAVKCLNHKLSPSPFTSAPAHWPPSSAGRRRV